MWTGDPICYKRQDGSALIVGRFHYLFDQEGSLVSAQPASRPILASILQYLYKDKALAMAAYVKEVPPTKVYTEEDMQVRQAEIEGQAADMQKKAAAAIKRLEETDD